MAWTHVQEAVFGTVEIEGETRRCQLIDRDDEAGLVRVNIVEPGSPAVSNGEPGEVVLAISADRFTPDERPATD